MYLSLGEADDFAHAGNRPAYLKMLSYYDKILDGLFSTLKEMSIYDETLIIISTDHGRGSGDEWTEHGDQYLGSKQTWAFVLNGELVPASVEHGVKHYSTLSIRPTVEKVFNPNNG
jgi:arylsulfatase A-like enzyme